MDTIELESWIEAQQPPVLEDALDARPAPGLEHTGSADPESDSATQAMRMQSIREAAFAFGAQTGLAWRYDRLRELTQKQEGTLDVIANFAPFMADKYLLLPSITQTRNRFDLNEDRSELRTVQVQYLMSEAPRAVTQPPTWRDYLWRVFEYPQPPHPKLMPATPKEVEVWKAGVRAGWSEGVRQAQLSWENNLAKLVRDVRGRITYRILEARGVVQRPIMVGGIPQMTKADNGRVLNAGESVYQITVPVSFKDTDTWGAVWRAEITDDLNFSNMDVSTAEPSFRHVPQEPDLESMYDR